MTKRQLLDLIDGARIKEAIQRAEQQTSGEVMVSVAPLFWGSVDKAARRAFDRLGVFKTRENNGILIFVVPSRRKFTILGDTGIHEKVGQEFWNHVANRMSEQFRHGDFTEGLVQAIDAAGEQLATYFPYDATTDKNELPDDVDFG